MSKVVSYSLYGNKPFYCNGALENAKNTKKWYGDDWQSWFYIYDDVSSIFVNEIKKYADKIIHINKDFPIKHGMFWRFLPILDDTVDVMIVRDLDSRCLPKEKKCIDEWLQSDKIFHIIRDANRHLMPMMGGMFGIKKPLNFDFGKIIYKCEQYWNDAKHKYNVDQLFLANVIYPLTINNRIVHDAYNHFELDGYNKLEMTERFIGEQILENGESLELTELKEINNGYVYFHKESPITDLFTYFYEFMKQIQLARNIKKILVVPEIKYKNDMIKLSDFINFFEYKTRFIPIISLQEFVEQIINSNQTDSKTELYYKKPNYNVNSNIFTTKYGKIDIIKCSNTYDEHRPINNTNIIFYDIDNVNDETWNYDFHLFKDYEWIRMSLMFDQKLCNIVEKFVDANNMRTIPTCVIDLLNLDNNTKILNCISQIKDKIRQVFVLRNGDNSIETVNKIMKKYNIDVLDYVENDINDLVIRVLIASQCQYDLFNRYDNIKPIHKFILEEKNKYYFGNRFTGIKSDCGIFFC